MTRKILVKFDIENPNKKTNEFLYPKPTETGFELTGIKTKKKSILGMIILTDIINENDIFAKIVDSGVQIPSVENLLLSLKEYVQEIQKFKIGNILYLNDHNKNVEFILKYQRITRKRTNMKGI